MGNKRSGSEARMASRTDQDQLTVIASSIKHAPVELMKNIFFDPIAHQIAGENDFTIHTLI